MSESFKVSGKKAVLPAPDKSWRFEVRPGGWIIAEREGPGGQLERKRFMLSVSKNKLSFSDNGVLYHGEVLAESRGGGASSAGDSDLVAQFPGKVRKILAQAGQVVEEGSSLLLVEAMKMEFAIKAPFRGKIEKFLVQEGQQLSPGDRFLDLKPI